jgi:hypothetical protein
MAVGVVAFSIRQYAAIPVAAVALVALLLVMRERDRRRLVLALTVVGVTVALAVVLLAVWASVPNTKILAPAMPGMESLRWTVRTDTGYLRLVGVLLAPVLIVAGPIRLVRRAWTTSRVLSVLVVAAAGGWLVLQWSRLPNVPFVGNYFAREGVLGKDVLAGVRPPAIPDLLFDALAWVGMVSVVVMLLAAVPFARRLPGKVRAWRSMPESPEVAVLGLSIAGFGLAYTFAILTELPVFDRYALPLFPMVALLLLRTPGERAADSAPPARIPEDTAPAEVGGTTGVTGAIPRVRWVGAGLAVVVLGLVGMAYTAESASYDATRWRVGELAVARGYSPLQVDVGFEWVGWHRQHGPPWRVKGTFAERRKIRKVYSRPFCVKVSVGRKGRGGTIIASATSTAPTRDPARIRARKLDVPCVPGEPVGLEAAIRAG